MYIKFNSRVRYDSPYEDLDDEWHLIEDYMQSLSRPPTARNGYFTSEDFWWYDVRKVPRDDPRPNITPTVYLSPFLVTL